MAVQYSRRLGEMIDAIMLDERLTVSDIMRPSGLRRNTIQYLRKGRTRRPKDATLRLLARGLATDPRTGELDMAKMTRYKRHLTIAAGYADPDAAEGETMLESLLRYQFQSRVRAARVAELVRRCKGLDDDAITRVLETANEASIGQT